jgi:hypothetical protein
MFATADNEPQRTVGSDLRVRDVVRQIVTHPKLSARERLGRLVLALWQALCCFNVFYLVPYLVCSVLAVAVSPFFNVFHLLDFVRLFKIPYLVFRSVIESAGKILSALFFSILAIFAMAALRFAQFNHRGATYTLGEQNFRCDASFAECFFSHLDGTETSEPSWDVEFMSTGVRLGATFYNLVFRIVVSVVIAGLVTSILLDSFSSLREKTEEAAYKLENSCLVCTLRKRDFASIGLSLHDHLCVYHNMWGYLCLWESLERRAKAAHRLNPLERHILDSFAHSKLSLLPLGETARLQLCSGEERED